jgi:hypothetical protein
VEESHLTYTRSLILQVRKLRPRMAQRPALQSVRYQCKITTLLYSNTLKENPLTFLQHLKDAIRKHTTVDPESQVREVLLNDKFLTVSP